MVIVDSSKSVVKERVSFIDKACGIAILLVVYGHIWFPETIDMKWYFMSHKFIYKFHMPLFICLSGYLAFLSTSNKSITSKTDYLKFQKKKLHKFLPAYLVASIGAILLDIFYKHLPRNEIIQSIYNMFFVPASGSAVFVWYLYVLFGFYLVTPFLVRLSNGSQYVLLLVGFLFTNASFSQLFSADLFCKYFFFFLCGGVIYNHKEQFFSTLIKNGNWLLILTVCLLSVDVYIDMIIPYQLLSISVIMSTFYLSILNWPSFLSKIFVALGVSSFAIYILNGPVLDLYYLFFKSILKSPIDGIFVFSSIPMALTISILIRIVFNRIIPPKFYSL
jgi:fucose 4-O-acetylase-like acetyltransferase